MLWSEARMPVKIEIRKFKDMDLRGGTVIEGFPSVGMVSTMACSYLISALSLDQICALESDDFPPMSMIYSTKPKFPARIYAHEDPKIAVFITEFPLPNKLHRPIARRLLSWAEEQGCERIISLEGLPVKEISGQGNKPNVWAVGSTDAARKELEEAKIDQLDVGMIAGVTGVLLNEGRWIGFRIISLLAEARPDIPDALSAARLIEKINTLIPEVNIDAVPLYKQAEEIEAHFEKLKAQAEPAIKEPPVQMFR